MGGNCDDECYFNNANIEFFDMKIQSNGMGTQSLAMYLMSSVGILPRFDYSIFVDTGKEKPRTYEVVGWLNKWRKKNNGISFVIIKWKNLYRDLMKENSEGDRFSSIPAFTRNEDGSKGMLKRQCTNEYKIEQINKKVKELQGKTGNQRFDKFYNYIGFSLDELGRISVPRIAKEIRVYPFCNYERDRKIGKYTENRFFKGRGITRGQLRDWLLDNNYPDPGKSSCIFCPYGQNSEWRELKKDPKIWRNVVRIDENIRDGTKKGINSPCYLHRSLKPIDEVDLDESNDTQLDLFENCNGVCHI